MNETGPRARTGREGRWIGIALLASLALNLFLAGLIAVALFRLGPAHRLPHPGPALQLGLPVEIMAALSAEERDRLGAVFTENRGEARKRFRTIRGLRRELIETIEAEPFDPAELERVFSELSIEIDGISSLAQTISVSVLSELSLETRQEIARQMRERPRRFGPPGTSIAPHRMMNGAGGRFGETQTPLQREEDAGAMPAE